MSKNPKMPKSVEDAAKKADELWDKTYGKTVKPATDSNIEPLGDDPALDKVDAQPEPTPVVTPEPVADKPEPEPEPHPEPKPEPAPASEDFKHKFDVLQGKYNAEVPGLAFELAQANQKIKELEAKTQIPRPAEPPAKATVNLETDERIKAFKTDYPDVFEASTLITKGMLDERFRQLDEKLNTVEKTVGSVTETFGHNERERFKSAMDQDPDVGQAWRTLNKDPEFIGSLQTTDVYTGRTKHELLNDAWARMDKNATLQFFKDFKKTKASPPAAKPKVKDVDPNKIDPPRGGSGGPSIDATDANQPTVTPTDIARFYKNVANGFYRGKEAEAEKEEQRLLRAIGALK